MNLTSATLRAMQTNFNVLFNKAFANAQPKYQMIATEVPSTASEETYAWLGDMPKMREWIGERVVNNLQAHGYTIRNKDFESTISVPRNAIEDDNIGVYAPLMEMMGSSAAAYPDELVFTCLNEGTKRPCYDGQSFFSTTHPVGKNKVSNKGTKKLTNESYGAARASMMSLNDENGKPLNITPNLLVVPPALEGMARKIVEAEYTENGATNIYKGTAKVLVTPWISSDTFWCLLDTTKPIKPFIFQNRKPAKFTSKTAPTDDNVFFSKEYVYGTDARGNAGYGMWQMAYGSTGESA